MRIYYLRSLLSATTTDVFAADDGLVEHALASLATMTLRSPHNAQKIIDTNVAIDMVVKTMRKHYDKQSLQRQGCLLIRNIAARNAGVYCYY